MALVEELKQILNRIEKGQQTNEDITILHQLLLTGDRQIVTQFGKHNVNIGEGEKIHIGDHIYNQSDRDAVQSLIEVVKGNKQAIEALVKAIQNTKPNYPSYYSYEDDKLDDSKGIKTFIYYAYEDRQLRDDF